MRNIPDKLAMLRAVARKALAARDAIDDWFSPQWLQAHEATVAACLLATAEMKRLASDPKTRYGSWRTPADVELMVLGLL
jgi:hypothetical protein